MVRDLLGPDVDLHVAAAMAELPRHAFLPAELAGAAYDDRALAIGSGQTISQPRVVAAMLTALALRPGQTVLDVGAGSGYAAALISRLVSPGGQVIAIERQGSLTPVTRARLKIYAPEVDLRCADAFQGTPEGHRFAAIHIACACAAEPEALLAQLIPGGRMVLPLGPHDGDQRLVLISVGAGGRRTRTALGRVRFVPALAGVVSIPTG